MTGLASIGPAVLALLAALPPAAQPVVFGILAGLSIATALVVLLHRNLVIRALFLVVHLISVAGLYALIGAYFLAAIQVIVYAGAILVLIIFVIMLLNLQRESRTGPGLASIALSGVAATALVVFLVRAARDFRPTATSTDPEWGTVARIADALFGPYFFPFEVVSLVLIAGMIGAILLAKRHLEG